MIVGEPRFASTESVTIIQFTLTRSSSSRWRASTTAAAYLAAGQEHRGRARRRTWTITLNPDYKWSNGQPITDAGRVYPAAPPRPKLGGEVASMFL